MKTTSSIGYATTVLCFAAGALLPATAAGQAAQPAQDSGKWQFTASIYGWVPVIDGRINYPDDKGSTDIHVSMSDVLNHLKMTFQGNFEAHNGRWGMFTDVVYVDLGGSKSRTRDLPIGGVRIPATATADVNLDLKALVWTVAGEYRVVSDPAWTVDLLAGARLLQLEPTLGYSITGDLGPIVIPGRNGSKQVDESLWDAIVGVKGRYTFGDKREWFVPFYLDVGTGQSKSTWQGAAGVGYAYRWGDVVALYRYLDYTGKSGKPVADMNMGGPMLGVAFRW
jgi:hypothetical protein